MSQNKGLSPGDLGAQLRSPSGEIGLQVASQMNQSNAELNQVCIAALQSHSTQPQLLEIGPGNAGFLDLMYQRFPGLHYTGLDWSAAMVSLAQREHAGPIQAGQAHFLQGEVHAMPFEAARFDMVLSVHTLYFWPEIDETLKEIHRVLKPGGHLVLGFGDKAFMQTLPFTANAFQLYAPETVSQALFNAGFKDLQHQRHLEHGLSNTGQRVEKHLHCLSGKVTGA